MTAGNKSDKYYFFWAGGIIGLLLILGWFFQIRIEVLKKNNLKNLAMLNQVLPGFNNQSIGQLRGELNNLKADLNRLAGIFDPKERWFKKDYDLSIYFVEELGKINQSLKTKATNNQVDFPELGFKEKLPEEKEAFYLLTQLYGLKEIINLGMDYRINFKSITPLDIEEQEGLSGIKLAKTRIEATCPAEDIVEFIIQLNNIFPMPYLEAFSLKSHDSSFEMNLTLSHIMVDSDRKDKQEFPASLPTESTLSEAEQNFIRILRAKNPFLVEVAEEAPLSGQKQTSETGKPKKLSRFLYKGKAILRAKEVVAIEDVLNLETVFLGQGEKIDNFILREFSNEEAVLENIDNGQKIIIKREEE
jgi:hypothetical protein